MTPLHRAAALGHTRVVQLLLAHGANKEATCNVRVPGATAVMWHDASERGARRRFMRQAGLGSALHASRAAASRLGNVLAALRCCAVFCAVARREV